MVKDNTLTLIYLKCRKLLKLHVLRVIEKVQEEHPELDPDEEPELFLIRYVNMQDDSEKFAYEKEFSTTSFPLDQETKLLDLLNGCVATVVDGEEVNVSLSSPITRPRTKQTDMFTYCTTAPTPLPSAGAQLSLGSRLSRELGDQLMETESQQEAGPISSSICIANRESSFTLSTDQEPGQSQMTVEVKTYVTNKIRKVNKRNWWKFVDTKLLYVVPQGDRTQTQVENLIIGVLEKVRADPSHQTTSKKKFSDS